jgi:tetratricopeptide (TPR) repeat protein
MERKYDEADALLIKAFDVRRKLLGEDNPATLDNRFDIAILRLGQGRYAEAETILVAVVDAKKRMAGEENADTLEAITSLAEAKLRQQKYSEAEALLRGALASYEKTSPDAWERARAQSLLGSSLAAQQKYADAETLLLAGYRGMNAHIDSIPFEDRTRVDETGRQIVQIYEQWGKPEKAADWRSTIAQK